MKQMTIFWAARRELPTSPNTALQPLDIGRLYLHGYALSWTMWVSSVSAIIMFSEY